MVDDSILGGVIVKIENKVIDGSVKHRLEEIKNEMIKNNILTNIENFIEIGEK
jgi:F-type H+-transporting ATPase subunit delta